MNKSFPIFLMSIALASAACAQSVTGGVTMSTDPAKAAAVEKHAAELRSHPVPEVQAKPAATHAATHKTATHAKSAKSSTKAAVKPAATK
jgi:hypothetical protein